jgi:hypothetical protein
MPLGASSRAALCAIARSPALAAAKATKPSRPRTDAVAPVNRIEPRPRHARRFAPGEEAREAGHLPDFCENPGSRLEQAEADIGADVKHHHFERPDPRFYVVEQRDHVGFGACVDSKSMRDAALSADLVSQRF